MLVITRVRIWHFTRQYKDTLQRKLVILMSAFIIFSLLSSSIPSSDTECNIALICADLPLGGYSLTHYMQLKGYFNPENYAI